MSFPNDVAGTCSSLTQSIVSLFFAFGASIFGATCIAESGGGVVVMETMESGITSAARTVPLKMILAPLVSLPLLIVYIRYRRAIHRRLRQAKEESWLFGAGVTMERTQENQGLSFHLLELSEEYRKNETSKMRMMSLGEYMSTLRPKMPEQMKMKDLPNAIQREVEAGLTSALLKALGPHLGGAVLPAVGAVHKQSEKVSHGIANKLLSSRQKGDAKGGLHVSFLSVFAFSEINADVKGGKHEDGDPNDSRPVTSSAMDKMNLGEVTSGPSFADKEGQFPDEFIVEEHFDRLIRGMEDRLRGHQSNGLSDSPELQQAKKDAADGDEPPNKDLSSSSYDPEDRRVGKPVPVNPRLFPDLHFGWGDALSSHTKREILKMRLLSILLNRLGANYDKYRRGDHDRFSVRMKASDSPITTPSSFIRALIDSGHDVSVAPTSRTTTFGLGMCIKEQDGSFTQVPLAVFVESGYEDSEGRMAQAMMPHSGLLMYISGPLIGNRADGTPSELLLQHFLGIEGFCGWKAHACPEVPFNEDVPGSPRLTGRDVVRATRVAALYANVLNGLASELNLPFGGYSTTAVCNDSAALLQHVLYGETTIYPLTSIGLYMQRTMRYAQKFGRDIKAFNTMREEVRDIRAIIKAMKELPNDINASPANAVSAAKRMLRTLPPKLPFQIMVEAKDVMESILREDKAAEL